MTETVIAYLGLFVGVVSVCVTSYFAIRFSERKEPRYSFLNEEKLARSKETLGDIEIKYRGKSVNRVTSTYVWFWNKGRRPIRRNDIPDSKPILVELRDSHRELEVLSAEIYSTTRQAIAFETTQRGERAVELRFDFLDQSDGAAIEIRHTGTEETSVDISGIVLGAAQGIKGVKLPSVRASQLSSRAVRSRGWKIIASLTLVTLGVLLYFGFDALIKTRISLSQTNMEKALSEVLGNAELPIAVGALESASRRDERFPKYLSLFGMLLLGIASVARVWAAPYPFPRGLALGSKSKLGERGTSNE